MNRILSECRRRLRTPLGEDLLILFGLFALCLAIRFPAFADRMGRDEATFILMGQSLLDGNLPYTTLWDNKPPLLFVFMAAVIGFAGKSIIVIRFLGSFCVLAAAWWTFQIGSRMWDRATGLLAACVAIIFVTIAPGGQTIIAEVVALPGLMLAHNLLMRPTLRPRELFYGGLWISVACLVRLNLAYVAMAMGLLVAFQLVRTRGLRKSVGPLGCYVVGGMVPLTLITLPYLFTGELTTFIDSVFRAPLSYVSSRHPPLKAFEKIVGDGFNIQSAPLLLGAVGALGLWCRTEPARANALSADSRWRLATLACFGLATAWSIVGSGGAFGHYIIQVLPFLALPAARFYVTLLAQRPRIIRISGWLTLLFALYFSTERIWPSYGVPHRASTEEMVAKYIQEHNTERRPVYLMTAHGAHWYMNTEPITKTVTHPTNITKPDLFPYYVGAHATPYTELKKIFALKPEFIVVAKKTNLASHPKTEALFQQTLKRSYRKVKTFGSARIYALKKVVRKFGAANHHR